MNLYAYVWNDPLNAIDPYGLAGEPFNRDGPIDQSGRNGGRTGNPITGPHKNPKHEAKKRLLKKLADQLGKQATGLGGLASKNPLALALSALLNSGSLNEGEQEELERIREELDAQEDEKSDCP